MSDDRTVPGGSERVKGPFSLSAGWPSCRRGRRPGVHGPFWQGIQIGSGSLLTAGSLVPDHTDTLSAMSDINIGCRSGVRPIWKARTMASESFEGAGGPAAPSGRAESPRRLRRNLGAWQVLAVSLGVTGLSLSANINPQGAVTSVGRAIPLAFAISFVAVLLLSYSFVRLSQHFNTAGSVFGFVGATLGAPAGAVAGWCL